MSKNIKILIAVGGTGGHVFPGCYLANHLINEKYEIKLVTDKRGYKYSKKFNNLDISILPSSPLRLKNIFSLLFSLLIIFFSTIISFLFLVFNRPSIIFGMGGYASFPICLAATVLKIKFVIYENNLIIGKANKYLLPFAKKIFVANKELEGIPNKYQNKTIEIGNIINEKIFKYFKKEDYKKNDSKKTLNILVLGGSQAAKIFAETLPDIFKNCSKDGLSLKIYQHCLSNQNEKLKLFYRDNNLNCETFNFSDNLLNYFSKVDLAITRSGSSMISELTNANIPFISVPLPSSADNHQLKNALFYKKKKFAFLIEEKDLKVKLPNLLKDIFKNYSILSEMKQHQRQFSDKNVYKNINQTLIKKIIDEKINLGQKEIIHFVGIGGIGMSGLAQIMKNMGFQIQGSDQNKNKNTTSCKNAGIKVFIGHSKKNLKNSTIIVRTSAIKNNNHEIKYAKKKKIPIYSRAEVLADVVSLKKNIIITGSHGKTTTTSLVSKIFTEQKLDPTIINGGVINSLKSNAKLGKGEWAILEADESDGSFLKIPINYSIVTNIDYEHIEYYKSFKNLEKSFVEFINKTPPTGKSIICVDNKNIKKY